MSSNYTAGVPIKKRRFPLIRPPSPASEEQSLLPVANESLQKENSSLSEGSVLSNASVPASSSALSEANKDSLREEIKGNSDAMNVTMVHSNAGSSSVKIEEPSITMHPLSMAGVGSIKKLVPAEKSANTTIISAKTELNLSSGETSTPSIGKDVSSKKLEKESNSEPSKTSEITELTLGIKEHQFLGMPGQNGERSQNQERGEPISLNLSSSKVESSNRCRSNDFELNTEDANRPTNRSNWDLNTTTDAWDGQMVDETLGRVAMDGFNAIGGTHDVKPLISSIGIIGDRVTVESQIHKKNESRSNGAIQPDLSSWYCNSNDNLHLALSSSFLLSNVIQNPSSPSASGINQKPPSSPGSIVNQKLPSSPTSIVNQNPSGLPASTVNQKPSNSPESTVNQKLSNSPASNVNQKPSSSLLNPSSNMGNVSVRKTFVLTGNLDEVNIRTIKSEPFDEMIKNDFNGATVTPKELLEFRALKSELVESCKLEGLKSSTFGSLKFVDPRSVKSEPVHDAIQETVNKIVGTSSRLDKMMLPDQYIRGKSTGSVDLPGKTTRSVDLSATGDVSNSFEHCLSSESSRLSGVVPQENSENAKLITTDTMSASVGHTMSASVGHDGDEVNAAGIIDTVIAEDKNVDDREQPRLKVGDVAPRDSEGNAEGSASDDEKINLSGDMLEEDSYGTDYESDGNHDLGAAMDAEEDGVREEDFEDGEVREPLAVTTMEEPICEERESQPFNSGDSDRQQMDFVGLPGGDRPTTSYVENKDTKVEKHSELNNNNIKKIDETTYDEKADKVADDNLQESLAVELPTNGAANCPKGKKIEESFDEDPGASQGNSETVVQGPDGDVRNTDLVDKNIPALPKADVAFNVDNTATDTNSGGHKSRIINLQASISSSPGRAMTIPSRSLPTRAGRLPVVALEGDKLCSRGREEIYFDGSHKFSRYRHQDRSSRNTRLNFGRGRERISRRVDTLRDDWNPEQDFVPKFCNGPVEFHVPRHKYGLATDLEFNRYNARINGAFAGTGRGRRKPLNDDAPVFHYPSSRRRSPGGREGPLGRGQEMIHRIPRNISPSRCIGEDGSVLVGSRHGEKFTSGLLRTHLKSPIGSRRRSPDGFGGHPELPNRRSPPIYVMERMRSSDHSCFPTEMVVRRDGSPYLSRQSNELQDIDSGRDLGHPSLTNRSPSGRVLFRNTRRFDMMDPRERTDNDDYFSRPMHSVRYQEIGPDGPSEERRRFTERRGPVRPFRPPYNGTEGGNFHLNAENDPRLYRFSPENDSEFDDRGNLREREFDRRIKSWPRNAPRRTRNIEEQKGNYGHGGPVWHDNAFDDMSGIKRRRF